MDHVSLELRAGEVLGFLGPNGAGKSTTLRLALGLLRPTSGTIAVLGHPAGSDEARAKVAYVAGDVSLWPQLTGADTLTLLAALHGDSDAAYTAQLIERFELDPRKRMRAYSKGNRQKVALIGAFATRAEVLLLDEPTSGLDPLMDRVFRECVGEARERGQAILLSSHMLSEVEHLCSRVAMIRSGQLFTVADVAQLRTRVGVEFDVTGDADGLDAIEGVTHVESLPDGARVRVVGPPGAFFAALATRNVTAVHGRESSLEEIFLSFYDESNVS
ncbi:MAG: ABC transporter ATP-binding protein [Acidobacteria bacterium]|nr:ABC transporter ATP-binding protein [Acidobacteriota bacterium]